MSCTASRCPALQSQGLLLAPALPMCTLLVPAWQLHACSTAHQVPKPTSHGPLWPKDTQFCAPISPAWQIWDGSHFPKPSTLTSGCSGVMPSSGEQWPKAKRCRGTYPAAGSCPCTSPRAQPNANSFYKQLPPLCPHWGVWGCQPLRVQHSPLPFFSIASTSFISSGGAISGGLNCSCKSGRGDPGERGGKERRGHPQLSSPQMLCSGAAPRPQPMLLPTLRQSLAWHRVIAPTNVAWRL